MRHENNQIDGKTLGIGVLSVTAAILFVGLMLVSNQPPRQAQAIGMNDRAGDYIMLTQQLSTTTEAVVVIDAAAKQMIAYEFDYNNKVLEILQRVNLADMPKPGRANNNDGRRRR